MRIAYLDCASGISGDMLLGALVDAGVPSDAIIDKVRSLELPDVRVEFESVKRKGFRGTKVHIHHPPEHKHRHLRDIRSILERSSLTSAERALAEAVFVRLAEAEARVHGTTVEKVHFHEVGAVDSIVDIVGACVGWLHVGAERAISSPIPAGGGFVEIAHGRCSVPAPATAELLREIPLAQSPCEAELTTPTGAALLGCLVREYGPLPPMAMSAVGYGAGTHDFPTHPNLLRLIVGEYAVPGTPETLEMDEVQCLETNLDDATGEAIAYCIDRLFQAGALDAFVTPIIMKKGRPGVTISVLCQPSNRAAIETVLFDETSTIGVRHWTTRRTKLPRESISVDTQYGMVDGKLVRLPDGRWRFSPEFESCRQHAEAHRVKLETVMQAARDAYAAVSS